MSFALLFIAVFIIGFILFYFTQKWQYSVFVPTVLFIISVLWDAQANMDEVRFSLYFGVPLVLFAGLLGAYIYQLRFGAKDQ